MITGGRDNIIRLYDTENANARSVGEYKSHTSSITSLSFDNPADENVFVSTSKDKTFRVWDIRKAKTAAHIERT